MMELLVDEDAKLRSVAAFIVAHMAQFDFPEVWPDMFNNLMNMMRSRQANAVDGSLKMLSEFVGSNMSADQLDLIMQLVPELHAVFVNNDGYYQIETRITSVGVFKECFELISAAASADKDVITKYAGPAIMPWIDSFVNILSQPLPALSSNNDGVDEMRANEFLLRSSVVGVISSLIRGYSKYIPEAIPKLVEPVWVLWRDLSDSYQRIFVHESEDQEEEDDPSMHPGFIKYVTTVFELLSVLSSKKSTVALFVDEEKITPTQLLIDTMYVSIKYAQITTEQIEEWDSDPAKYITDDDDDTFSFNVRIAARDMIGSFAEKCPRATVLALAQAIVKLVNETSHVNISQNWTILESSLMAVSVIAPIIEDDPSCLKVFNPSELFQVCGVPLANSDITYAQIRALSFASNFPTTVSFQDNSNSMLPVAVSAMNGDRSLVLRISAMQACVRFCNSLNKEVIKPFQSQMITNSADLISKLNGDLLNIALDSLAIFLGVNSDISAQHEALVGPVILNAWAANPTDRMLVSTVSGIVEFLISSSLAAYEAFCMRALPVLLAVVAGRSPLASDAVPGAIDIISVLLKICPTESLPDSLVYEVFPLLIQSISSATDSEIIHSVQQCLTTLVSRKALSQIASIKNSSDGSSGLDQFLHVISRLLDPSVSESLAIFVGDIVSTLVRTSANDIQPILPGLIEAVVRRLATAKTSTFIGPFLVAIGQLVIHEPAAVVNCLANSAMPEFDGSQSTGLAVLARVWTEHYDAVTGYYGQKASAIALTRLFSLGDPRLDSIMVRGDLIEEPSSNQKGDRIIKTRSKAKANPDRYTAIPFSAKIVSLLLMAFGNSGDAAEDVGDGDDGWDDEYDDDDDDEGDWEDDVDDIPGLMDADEFGLLSEQFDLEDDDDYEDTLLGTVDVASFKNDPIYTANLNQVICDFFRQCAAQNTASFSQLVQQYISAIQQKKLAAVINK
ncbi:ARM repeat-containing protein [Ramicandelaber brevisporus]|nr:ARM repeat-containing protein [Ramicandelaber brevisporus]